MPDNCGCSTIPVMPAWNEQIAHGKSQFTSMWYFWASVYIALSLYVIRVTPLSRNRIELKAGGNLGTSRNNLSSDRCFIYDFILNPRKRGDTMSSAHVPRVLVTGASGFLGCHIVKQLLEGGEFIVRGTVRNLTNEKKVEPLKKLCPNAKHDLELVQADLLDKDCWERLV